MSHKNEIKNAVYFRNSPDLYSIFLCTETWEKILAKIGIEFTERL